MEKRRLFAAAANPKKLTQSPAGLQSSLDSEDALEIRMHGSGGNDTATERPCSTVTDQGDPSHGRIVTLCLGFK